VPDRSHDTDPLADTQSPDSGQSGDKRRAVHSGDVLGRYELGEEIGEGGMATVYRARDRELRREVAIKVLFPHLARRTDVVRRFHREARAAAALEHPNILRVYDVGGAEGNDPPYIVMELIRGRSLLGEIEQRGAMLAELAACVGALLADALAVAHEAGVIHRDVKPANVMISTSGKLLLTDFGVARLETEDSSLVTKTGSVLGTPAYMSPEQASGDTATTKSDLYSLGATLYQLATGALPYSGSPARVLSQIAQGALVPPSRKHSAVGPDLSRVIERLMASEPSARPAKAADVAAELRAIASAGGLGEPMDELTAYFSDAEKFVADRLPKIVSAVVASGQRAVAEQKLPRAIALADRASALAPDDPAVAALVSTVTEGGKASRRRRVLAFVGLGVVAAGGATFGAMQLGLLGGETPADAHVAIATTDAVVAATFDAGPDAPIDAIDVAAMASEAGVADASVVDAGRPRDAAVARDAAVRGDAARPQRDASPLPPDGSVVVPIDALAPRPDAAPAKGTIVVKNDTWCDVSIDGIKTGKRNGQSISVDAGSRLVGCEQTGVGLHWQKTVEVTAGKQSIVIGSMLNVFDIVVQVDAVINGTSYRAGTTARLKAGRYDLVIDGQKTHFDVRGSCVVRATPEPGCY